MPGTDCGMKQLLIEALEALECAAGHRNLTSPSQINDCAVKLRAAINAPEQEPIYQYQMGDGSWIDQIEESYKYNLLHGQATVRKLYTHPQPVADDCFKPDWAGYRQGVEDGKAGAELGPVADLTDDEILDVFATCHLGKVYAQDYICGPKSMRIAEGRAVLAAQKVKP